ncbi:MAG TPA: hypothetical protein VN027_08855 [Isoptericola sp.]|nr:hypothetical protein [Isoptericola sp.]
MTTTSVRPGGAHAGSRTGPWLLVGVVAVAVAFLLGRLTAATTHWSEGHAEVFEDAPGDVNFVGLDDGDWSYAFAPGGVQWVDGAGQLHESGLPECVAHESGDTVRFGWTEARLDGTTWRAVVAVDCRVGSG